MPDLSTWTLFIGAATLLLVTPGPAVLYIVGRSLERGPRSGIVATLGIASGTLFHVAAAAIGVSALLVSSALAFSVVRYLGAAYLLYLGLRTLLRPADERIETRSPRDGLSRDFVEGLWVNLLNPKTALFFFAFLPQFVDPARGAVAPQVLALGAVFVGLGVASDSLWALLAGTVGRWLRERSGASRWGRYVSGSLLIGLGLAAAVGQPEHN